MRSPVFSALLLAMVSAAGSAAELEDLSVSGNVRVAYPENGAIRESAEIVVRFTLPPGGAIEPLYEAVTIRFAEIRANRSALVTIPAYAFDVANNGYQLISSDPDVSGVTHEIVDADGLPVRDLTGRLRSFDARLVEIDEETHTWRLSIEAVTRSANGDKWQQLAEASRTEIALGDDSGARDVRAVSFVFNQ